MLFVKYCINCGKQNIDEAVCCQYCGFMSNGMDVPTKSTDPNEQIKDSVNVPEQKNKKTGKIILISIIAIIVVTAIIVSVCVFVSHRNNEKKNAENIAFIYDYLNEECLEFEGSTESLFYKFDKENSYVVVYSVDFSDDTIKLDDISQLLNSSFSIESVSLDEYIIRINDADDEVLHVNIDESYDITISTYSEADNVTVTVILSPAYDRNNLYKMLELYENYDDIYPQFVSVLEKNYYYNTTLLELISNVFVEYDIEIYINKDGDYVVEFIGSYTPNCTVPYYTLDGKVILLIDLNNNEVSFGSTSESILSAFKLYAYETYGMGAFGYYY